MNKKQTNKQTKTIGSNNSFTLIENNFMFFVDLNAIIYIAEPSGFLR